MCDDGEWFHRDQLVCLPSDVSILRRCIQVQQTRISTHIGHPKLSSKLTATWERSHHRRQQHPSQLKRLLRSVGMFVMQLMSEVRGIVLNISPAVSCCFRPHHPACWKFQMQKFANFLLSPPHRIEKKYTHFAIYFSQRSSWAENVSPGFMVQFRTTTLHSGLGGQLSTRLKLLRQCWRRSPLSTARKLLRLLRVRRRWSTCRKLFSIDTNVWRRVAALCARGRSGLREANTAAFAWTLRWSTRFYTRRKLDKLLRILHMLQQCDPGSAHMSRWTSV